MSTRFSLSVGSMLLRSCEDLGLAEEAKVELDVVELLTSDAWSFEAMVRDKCAEAALLEAALLEAALLEAALLAANVGGIKSDVRGPVEGSDSDSGVTGRVSDVSDNIADGVMEVPGVRESTAVVEVLDVRESTAVVDANGSETGGDILVDGSAGASDKRAEEVLGGATVSEVVEDLVLVGGSAGASESRSEVVIVSTIDDTELFV